MISKSSFLVLVFIASAAFVRAVPTRTLERRAEAALPAANPSPTAFSQIDISRVAGNGNQTEDNAAVICPSSFSATELEAVRRLAEDAESDFFNAALDSTTDTDTKNAIQCQKDRNKVLKNHCQLIKAQLQSDQAQIDENTKQLNKNRGDVTTRCANVNTDLFIDSSSGSSSGGSSGTTTTTTTTTADNAAATTTAASSGGSSSGSFTVPSPNPSPTSFAQIDISRVSGNGNQTEDNAAVVCPSSFTAAQLESIRKIAESAETDFFNPAISSASDSATQDAIQCQKDRNKVLKNHCQLIKAELQSDQAQIDENTKQLNKNRGDVTTRCASVDTSKFLDPNNA